MSKTVMAFSPYDGWYAVEPSFWLAQFENHPDDFNMYELPNGDVVYAETDGGGEVDTMAAMTGGTLYCLHLVTESS